MQSISIACWMAMLTWTAGCWAEPGGAHASAPATRPVSQVLAATTLGRPGQPTAVLSLRTVPVEATTTDVLAYLQRTPENTRAPATLLALVQSAPDRLDEGSVIWLADVTTGAQAWLSADMIVDQSGTATIVVAEAIPTHLRLRVYDARPGVALARWPMAVRLVERTSWPVLAQPAHEQQVDVPPGVTRIRAMPGPGTLLVHGSGNPADRASVLLSFRADQRKWRLLEVDAPAADR